MSKSMKTTQIVLRDLLRFVDGPQKEAVETTLARLIMAENAPYGNRRKRFVAQAEAAWSEQFLSRYVPTIGARGRLPLSYSKVEQVQKHLGRILSEEGLV